MTKGPRRNFTEETYDKAAYGYAKKYQDIGVRSVDVDKAFSFVHKENPRVVEIGCGGGREAKYILTKTNGYTGFDISKVMLEIAQKNVLEGHFEKADVFAYQFPDGIDIVFAFASLLHSSQEELKLIFKRLHEALNNGGVIYMSLKRSEEYVTKIVEGEYGPREFYYYTRQTILDVAGSGFADVFYEEQDRTEPWFTMILQKK